MQSLAALCKRLFESLIDSGQTCVYPKSSATDGTRSGYDLHLHIPRNNVSAGITPVDRKIENAT
jgi:hypothetical protein